MIKRCDRKPILEIDQRDQFFNRLLTNALVKTFNKPQGSISFYALSLVIPEMRHGKPVYYVFEQVEYSLHNPELWKPAKPVTDIYFRVMISYGHEGHLRSMLRDTELLKLLSLPQRKTEAASP